MTNILKTDYLIQSSKLQIIQYGTTQVCFCNSYKLVLELVIFYYILNFINHLIIQILIIFTTIKFIC